MEYSRNQHTPEMAVFQSWFSVLHPQFVLPGPNMKLKNLVDTLGADFKQLSRDEQLEMGRSMISWAKNAKSE